MVTAAHWRKLALALPEVEEKSHFEQPDFRVRNKIFAGLSADEASGTLKLPPELQSMLLDAEPDTFTAAAGAWGRAGWTKVELAHIESVALKDLLLQAWQLVAPKRLVAASSGSASAGSKPKKARKR